MTSPSHFEQVLASSEVIMAGGSIYERFRRHPDLVPDPDIAHAALIYDEKGANLLAGAMAEYINVAQDAGLPMLVGTPTWRAGRDRVQRSRFDKLRVNRDCAAFTRRLVEGYRTEDGPPVVIAGNLGPANDAYRPDLGLTVEDATQLHAVQADALAEAGVDVLVAMTHPALDEARGMARALEATGSPYVISFVVREAGTLLDGTPLDEAMDRIDQERRRAPVGYFVNCVHPTILEAALSRSAASATERLLGFRANAAAKSPEELDGSDELLSDAPDALAAEMTALHRGRRVKVLGGCCGTSAAHLRAIAEGVGTPAKAVLDGPTAST